MRFMHGVVVDKVQEIPGSIPSRQATFIGWCLLINVAADARINKK